MATPSELLHRAGMRRPNAAPPSAPLPQPPAAAAPVAPMPAAPMAAHARLDGLTSGRVAPTPVAPTAAPAAPAPLENAEPIRPARVIVPQPIRTNSVYHQLMARHDRMHTRHL